MNKRIIMLILTLTIALSIVSMGITATAFEVVGDPIVEGSAAIDILINAGESSSALASDLSDALYTKLKERLAAVGMGDVNVRISTPKVGLNTNDTKDWYVYDHYDKAWYADEPAWKASSGYGDNTNLRPYFPHTNATGTVYTGTDPANKYVQNRIPKMTIQQWVEGPKPTNYDKISNTEVTLGAFEQHIYNHIDSGVAVMDFVGYDTYSYADFMFYPCPSKEAKQVTFDVDSSNVNAHSLNGAGFLINAGIDSDKNLVGYYLYYSFGSTSTPTSVSLYQINSNVKAAEIHNATVDTTGSDQTKKGITSRSTLLKQQSIQNKDWNSKMSIRLTITPTSVLVEQKPKLGTDDYREVLLVTKASDNRFTDSGYNGFGPLVHYKQTSHTCVRASQFTYSNIKMAYINQSDDIFDVLSQANYLQNAERYFVDLTDDGANRSLDEGGAEAAAYMQAKEIRYITNHENELLNDGGSGSGPLGNNGETVYNDNNTGESDIDKLADKIAEYIKQQHGQPLESYSDSLPLSVPVALLSRTHTSVLSSAIL